MAQISISERILSFKQWATGRQTPRLRQPWKALGLLTLTGISLGIGLTVLAGQSVATPRDPLSPLFEDGFLLDGIDIGSKTEPPRPSRFAPLPGLEDHGLEHVIPLDIGTTEPTAYDLRNPMASPLSPVPQPVATPKASPMTSPPSSSSPLPPPMSSLPVAVTHPMIGPPLPTRQEPPLSMLAVPSQEGRVPARLLGFIRHYNKKLSPQQMHYLGRSILQFSEYYGLDYQIVASVIAIESSFRPNVVSSSGAIGLGQLKPATAKWLGVVDPYHPADNIAGTSRYLGYLLRKYKGNRDKALSAYYQGPGTVDRKGITPACRPYLLKFSTAFNTLIAHR